MLDTLFGQIYFIYIEFENCWRKGNVDSFVIDTDDRFYGDNFVFPVLSMQKIKCCSVFNLFHICVIQCIYCYWVQSQVESAIY